jgi:uncharacterized membrane protein
LALLLLTGTVLAVFALDVVLVLEVEFVFVVGVTVQPGEITVIKATAIGIIIRETIFIFSFPSNHLNLCKLFVSATQVPDERDMKAQIFTRAGDEKGFY